MVDVGEVLCIMGNYEFNVFGWSILVVFGSGCQYVCEYMLWYVWLIKEIFEQFEGYDVDWCDFFGWFQ